MNSVRKSVSGLIGGYRNALLCHEQDSNQYFVDVCSFVKNMRISNDEINIAILRYAFLNVRFIWFNRQIGQAKKKLKLIK